MGNKGR